METNSNPGPLHAPRQAGSRAGRSVLGREVLTSAFMGVIATGLLGAAIMIGSRNLKHFDAALVAYTFATLFAAFGITYRYSMWLQRPPTWVLFKRGWQTFFRRRAAPRNTKLWFQKVVSDFVLNIFIFKRGIGRGIAHMLIMWGCLLAFGITFPLVFGWIHFETVPNEFDQYIAHFFGFPVATMRVNGTLAFLTFHALVWASLLLLPGILLAMRRRMREQGAAAGQSFAEDILPLLLLFSITVTGLLLWVSYTWMHGYAYDFLAIFHAATVIFTLLWLPFGKFFHIFQRPAQLGAAFYKDAGTMMEPAECRRCGEPYMSLMQAEDLMHVEKQLGYRYEIPESDAEHYQFICPKCRRSMLALAQRELFRGAPSWAATPEILSTPHGNDPS